MRFLVWLSNTAPAVWARESDSIWAYPTVLFLHTFGLGALVGFTSVIDLRVLGFSSHVPLAPLTRFFKFIWIGFWINAISGVLLLINTPAKLNNPAFAVKMTCITLGVVNLIWLRREVFEGRPDTEGVSGLAVSKLGKILAGTSLLLWAVAITAGRLMAYVGPQR